MTLAEIETLLKQLLALVTANTAAITSLNNAISNYATDDDLSAITTQINAVQTNNTTLQNKVDTLTNSISKIDHLLKLMDVNIGTLTEGDLLQYGSNGKWHNVKPDSLGITGGSGGSATSLSGLTDVLIIGPSSGLALIYDSSSDKWKNGNIEKDSTDVSGFITKTEADAKYVPFIGNSTIDGNIIIDGTLHVTENITSNQNIFADNAITAKMAA